MDECCPRWEVRRAFQQLLQKRFVLLTCHSKIVLNLNDSKGPYHWPLRFSKLIFFYHFVLISTVFFQ